MRSSSRGQHRRFGKSHNEDGQILVLTAVMIAGMMAFAALAIDVGFLTHERRDLQNGADAMALAGGSQLKATGDKGHPAALTEAMAWATKNNVPAAEVTSIDFDITCSGESVANTITVKLNR